ncbi:MAG: asparagine synthase (glutamine-hydrolyzing) [Phycisphaeraceae bacterium]|nr:asparagine synthase (glutamine-hydrolyzing) [Phycisphaeraceae bacterium]
MCGLAGIIAEAPFDGSIAGTLCAALRHRGPDGAGILVGSPDRRPVPSYDALPPHGGAGADAPRGARYAFAHTRLAILDLTAHARQPICTACGRYALLFNGEIYDHLCHRPDLERAGATFRSHGDAETLLALLAHRGVQALGGVTGMYALAFIDFERRTVTLTRDPFGIKPLFIARRPGMTAFASEPAALLRLPGIHARADHARALTYLRSGLTDHDDGTMFAGIDHVPAGHLVEIHLDTGRPGPPRRNAVVPTAPPPESGVHADLASAAAALRARLEASVRLHMLSDVPIGTALSGGIDSSAIIALMRRVLGPGPEIHAIGFCADDPAIDETRWIDRAAEAAGARVIHVRADASGLAADLSSLVRAQGEPFGSTSLFAQWCVFRAAREHGIKVMLDGQGADELFAGYRPFAAARIASLLRRGRLPAAARLLGSAAHLPGGGLRLGARALRDAFPACGIAGGDPSLIDRGHRRQGRRRAETPCRANSPWATRGSEVLTDQLRLAVERLSLPMLLRYEDRNAMAWSVESRVPFCTSDLARFAFACDESLLIGSDGIGKRVLRQAMRGLVPDEILDRREKIAFATPERAWLPALLPQIRAALIDGPGRAIPLLDHASVVSRIERISPAPPGAGRSARTFDRAGTPALFRAWCLAAWTETFDVRWS